MRRSNSKQLQLIQFDGSMPEPVAKPTLRACPSQNSTEAEHLQIAIAIRAVKLGARPPVVTALSNLPAVKARKIYKDVTGREPIKGQMPSDPSYYTSDVDRHFQSAWLAQFYTQLAEAGDKHHEQVECMFITYEHYQKEFPNGPDGLPVISFDRYYLLIRCVLSGVIAMNNCKECQCVKLSVKEWDPKRTVRCPMCHFTSATHS